MSLSLPRESGDDCLHFNFTRKGKFPPRLILQDAVVRRERFRINLMAHGRWNWKMAKLPEHSKSNALPRGRGKYLQGETRRLIGYLRVGVFVLDFSCNQPNALIGGVDWVTKRWLWEKFAEAESLLGMIRGYSVSIWNITTSIHRVAFSFR